MGTHLRVLVLWTKVSSALEGLKVKMSFRQVDIMPVFLTCLTWKVENQNCSTINTLGIWIA